MNLLRFIALAALFVASPAAAQWQVAAGAIPLGLGAGKTGFGTVAGGAGTGAKCLTDTAPPTFAACPAGLATPTYATVAAVQAATIGAAVAEIRTMSYSSGTVYGGGIYRKVLSPPAHQLYIISADGAYWELQLTGGRVYPTQAGAVADGVFDNQTVLENAYNYAYQKQGSIFFEAAGVYAHSGTWVVGDSTCKVVVIDFMGDSSNSLNGAWVTIKHTGTGVNVQYDATTPTIGGCFSGTFGLTGRPLLTGNANTTTNLFIQLWHMMNVRVEFGDTSTVGQGVWIKGTVLSNIDILGTVNKGRVWTFKPFYGVLLEPAVTGPSNYSSANKFHIVVEGLINGVLNNGGASQTVFTGSLEGNSTTGYTGTGAGASRNLFLAMDNEANGSFDWDFEGETDSTLQGAIGVLGAHPTSLKIGATSHRIKVLKGYYDNVSVIAGATRNDFDGVSYQTAFSDSGTGTTWRNLYYVTGGTYAVDRLSSVGDTGTGPIAHQTSPTFITPALGTPASGVATNLTGTAAGLTAGTASAVAVGGITGLGANVPAWLVTASSANLRAAVTDETGTGLLYFQGGDIGTPSAGIGTNLTGTAAGLTAGNATKLVTPRAIGVGAGCGLSATGVNFDGTAAINPTLTGITTVACGGTGNALGVRLMFGGNSGATAIAASQTRYTGVATLDASAANVYVPVSFAGTFKNMVILTNGSPGVGNTWTATLQKTLAATGVTCTISSGTNLCSDITHTDTFSAGQSYSIQIVASAGTPATNIVWSLEFDPTP